VQSQVSFRRFSGADAALRRAVEAEILLGMRRKREYFEPDTFATEAPFLSQLPSGGCGQ
jgi:hypothetical protein